MATVGSQAIFSGKSYLALGRESTWGTYDTCTAGFDFLSSSIKTTKDSKILAQVERSRTHAKSFSMSKVVAGDISGYMTPDLTAPAWFLQNAFGGTVTSATATGETAGGAAFTHTYETGCLDQSYTGISINERKGGSSDGYVFQYSGGRVNQLSLQAQIDEPIMFTASMIFKDSTQASNDVESALTSTAWEPLSFEDARFSVEGTFASLTASSFWHVQNINFSMNNNLKSDVNSRRLGSDVLDVLPIGIQSYELSVGMRFDTLTAYDAMLAATELAAEFDFQGSTLGTSVIRRGLKLKFQKLTVKDAGDPEIGGPDEVLMATVTFNVLRDESASGYAVQAELTNDSSDV